jgi:hypothetical protein
MATQSQIRKQRNTAEIMELLGGYLKMKNEERDLYKPKDKQLRTVGDALYEYNPNDGSTREVISNQKPELRTVGDALYEYNRNDGSTRKVISNQKPVYKTGSDGAIYSLNGDNKKMLIKGQEEKVWVNVKDPDTGEPRRVLVTAEEALANKRGYSIYEKPTGQKAYIKRDANGQFFTVTIDPKTGEPKLSAPFGAKNIVEQQMLERMMESEENNDGFTFEALSQKLFGIFNSGEASHPAPEDEFSEFLKK